MEKYILFVAIITLAFLSIYCFENYDTNDDDDDEFSYIDFEDGDELVREKRSPDPDPRGARRKKKKKKKGSGPGGGGASGGTGKGGSISKPGDKTVYGPDGKVLRAFPIRNSGQNRFGQHAKQQLLAIITIGLILVYAWVN